MKTNAYIAFGFAFLLALGGAAAVLWRTPASEPAARTAQAVELEQPAAVTASERLRREQELEGLRQQVSRINADLQRVRTTVSNATGVPENADSTAPLSREEEEQRWLEHVKSVDRAFRDEPLRAGWSGEMAQKIREVAATDALTTDLVVDVQCRSRTCKLELANVDPRRGEPGVALIIRKFSTELQNAAIAHDGNLESPKASALYLSQASAEDSVPLVARR
jgi:hypothetical protein